MSDFKILNTHPALVAAAGHTLDASGRRVDPQGRIVRTISLRELGVLKSLGVDIS